jgi:hypothetical protein
MQPVSLCQTTQLGRYLAMRKTQRHRLDRAADPYKAAIFLSPPKQLTKSAIACTKNWLSSRWGHSTICTACPTRSLMAVTVAVLTGFDMLILRATYAPEMHSGMVATKHPT